MEMILHIPRMERWGAGVETPKNVRGEIGGWGRVPFNENLRPVVKYHLRRGVGLIKFLENGTRPQPPTSPRMPVPRLTRAAAEQSTLPLATGVATLKALRNTMQKQS